MNEYDYLMAPEMNMLEYILLLTFTTFVSILLIRCIFKKIQWTSKKIITLIVIVALLIALMFFVIRTYFIEEFQIWYIKAPFIGIMSGVFLNVFELFFKSKK